MLITSDSTSIGAPQNSILKGNQKGNQKGNLDGNLDATTDSSTEFQGQLDSKINNIWDLFHRRGRRTEALAQLDAEIGRYPERIYLHAWKGRMLAEIYESEAAMKEIDLVLRKLPNDSHALAIKARALAELSRNDEACLFAKRAIKIAPDNVYVAGTATRVFKDAHQFRDALEAAELVVKLEHNSTISLTDRALCLYELGGKANLERAAADLSTVIKNTSAKTVGFKNDIRLADIYSRLGQTEKAETVLLACCKRYPNAPQPLLEIIKFYEKAGQKEKAAEQRKKLDVLQSDLGI